MNNTGFLTKQKSAALILLLLCMILFFLGLLLGSGILPPDQWWSALPTGETRLHPIFFLRLVRITGAFIIGASLTLSGATFQAVLRNPLAEPFTLGISGGASVGAALSFLTRIHTYHSLMTVACAFAGALITLGFVLCLSRGGRKSKESLLLSGVITGTICSSILMYLFSVIHIDELASITWWLLGDLQGIDPYLLLPAGGLLILMTVILRICAPALNLLSLGDSRAWNGGVDPGKITLLSVICASLLAAMTISMAGVISFCGLIVPHIIRRILGCDHKRITLPLFLSGGGFLMFCDILSRILHPAKEIPIGVITSLIGGTLFLWIVNRRRVQQ